LIEILFLEQCSIKLAINEQNPIQAYFYIFFILLELPCSEDKADYPPEIYKGEFSDSIDGIMDEKSLGGCRCWPRISL